MIYTIVSDIREDDTNIIEVDLELWDKFNEELMEIYNLTLDLEKMGIDKEMDYPFQLSKDLESVVKKFREDTYRFPTSEEIENKMHETNYFVIENF